MLSITKMGTIYKFDNNTKKIAYMFNKYNLNFDGASISVIDDGDGIRGYTITNHSNFEEVPFTEEIDRITLLKVVNNVDTKIFLYYDVYR